jgi:hypothetical protein
MKGLNMKMMTCISINPVLCEISKAQCSNQGISFSATIEKLLFGWLNNKMKTEYNNVMDTLGDIIKPNAKNKTGFRGVKAVKPNAQNRNQKMRYTAEMYFNGVKKSIGSFKTAEQAAKAYDKALVKKTLAKKASLNNIMRILNFPLENYVMLKK